MKQSFQSVKVKENVKTTRLIRRKIVEIVWKVQTQILRENNFRESRSYKTVFFDIFRALNFINLVSFSFQKVWKFVKKEIFYGFFGLFEG